MQQTSTIWKEKCNRGRSHILIPEMFAIPVHYPVSQTVYVAEGMGIHSSVISYLIHKTGRAIQGQGNVVNSSSGRVFFQYFGLLLPITEATQQLQYSDWLQAGGLKGRSSSPCRVKNFHFSTSFRPALELT
jgi:hypothetical protein